VNFFLVLFVQFVITVTVTNPILLFRWHLRIWFRPWCWCLRNILLLRTTTCHLCVSWLWVLLQYPHWLLRRQCNVVTIQIS